MKKSTDNTCNLVKYIFIFGGNNPKKRFAGKYKRIELSGSKLLC